MYWAGNAKLLDNNLKCKSDPVLPGKKKKPKTNHNKNVSSTLWNVNSKSKKSVLRMPEQFCLNVTKLTLARLCRSLLFSWVCVYDPLLFQA